MSAGVRAGTGQDLGSGMRVDAMSGRLAAAREMTPEEIVLPQEPAAATLIRLPGKGYTTRLRQMRFEIVHTALEAYGWEVPKLRAPVPCAADISAMDEAFSWLALIPEGSFLLRRILGARALVHPLTLRHVFSWRRLAATLGADHKAVQRWHGNGVKILRKRLQEG